MGLLVGPAGRTSWTDQLDRPVLFIWSLGQFAYSRIFLSVCTLSQLLSPTKALLIIACTIWEFRNWKSWANARVKLHSQVHVESKNILSLERYWVQKHLSSKKILFQRNFGFKSIFGPNKFWMKKEFWVRKNFETKNIFDPKRICLQIYVDSDLNLCKTSQVRAFSPRACASLHGSLWKFGWWSSTILWTNFIKIQASSEEIWPKYVAQAFLPPPLNRQLRIGLGFVKE